MILMRMCGVYIYPQQLFSNHFSVLHDMRIHMHIQHFNIGIKAHFFHLFIIILRTNKIKFCQTRHMIRMKHVCLSQVYVLDCTLLISIMRKVKRIAPAWSYHGLCFYNIFEIEHKLGLFARSLR